MPRKFEENILVIASHNAGKLAEITALFRDTNIKIQSAASLQLAEPEEDGDDYLANALIKARACVLATNKASLADDSGIEVEALDNKPGVDTAPFTKSMGGREKIFALWEKDARVIKNPRAAFLCTQVLMWPDGYYEYAKACVRGKLVFPAQGTNGHGYDPVFMPDGCTLTMAQMSFAEKNLYSHRALALKALLTKVLVF